MALPFIFANAGAQSTCASPITNSQTTVVLASTSGFPVPAFGQVPVIVLDSGNPAFSANNPLATPFEYAYVTANNTGTNTLTWTRGQEGTTGHAFSAGATVAAVPSAAALGPLTYQNRYRFRAHLVGAASAAAASTTLVPLDTKTGTSFDPDGDFNTTSHQWTCPRSGTYIVKARIGVLLNNNPQQWQLLVFRNGAEYTRGTSVTVRGGATNDDWSLTFSDLLAFTLADTMDLRITNSNSNVTTLDTGANQTWLAAQYFAD